MGTAVAQLLGKVRTVEFGLDGAEAGFHEGVVVAVTAEHIKAVAKRVKTAKPKIALSEEHAKGLLPVPLLTITVDDL